MPLNEQLTLDGSQALRTLQDLDTRLETIQANLAALGVDIDLSDLEGSLDSAADRILALNDQTVSIDGDASALLAAVGDSEAALMSIGDESVLIDGDASGVVAAAGEAEQAIEEAGEAGSRSFGGFNNVLDDIQARLTGNLPAGLQSLTTGFSGLGAAAAGAVAGLALIGDQFDQAERILAVGAGTANLDQLNDDLQATIGDGNLANLQDTAAVLADVNTFFGLTGDAAQQATTQIGNFVELFGGDTRGLNAVMRQFGLEAEDIPATLDVLSAANQDLGFSSGELIQTLSRNGAAFAASGLDVQQTASLLGQFNRFGVEVNRAVPQLVRFLEQVQSEGGNASLALDEAFDSIRTAASDAEALEIAFDIGLSGIAAADFANAIRGAAIDISELNDVLGDTSGRLAGTVEEAETTGDRLRQQFDEALASLAPLGETVLQILNDGLDLLEPFLVALNETISFAASIDGAFRDPVGSVTDATTLVAERQVADFGELSDELSELAGEFDAVTASGEVARQTADDVLLSSLLAVSQGASPADVIADLRSELAELTVARNDSRNAITDALQEQAALIDSVAASRESAIQDPLAFILSVDVDFDAFDAQLAEVQRRAQQQAALIELSLDLAIDDPTTTGFVESLNAQIASLNAVGGDFTAGDASLTVALQAVASNLDSTLTDVLARASTLAQLPAGARALLAELLSSLPVSQQVQLIGGIGDADIALLQEIDAARERLLSFIETGEDGDSGQAGAIEFLANLDQLNFSGLSDEAFLGNQASDAVAELTAAISIAGLEELEVFQDQLGEIDITQYVANVEANVDASESDRFAAALRAIPDEFVGVTALVDDSQIDALEQRLLSLDDRFIDVFVDAIVTNQTPLEDLILGVQGAADGVVAHDAMLRIIGEDPRGPEAVVGAYQGPDRVQSLLEEAGVWQMMEQRWLEDMYNSPAYNEQLAAITASGSRGVRAQAAMVDMSGVETRLDAMARQLASLEALGSIAASNDQIAGMQHEIADNTAPRPERIDMRSLGGRL